MSGWKVITEERPFVVEILEILNRIKKTVEEANKGTMQIVTGQLG
jgi:hypothetical protein